MNKKDIVVYATQTGKEPFTEWHRSLDRTLRLKVLVRLERILVGSFGGIKYLSEGIREFRFKEGIRIYYAAVKGEIILLLAGGGTNNKREQSKDIEKAKEYLKEYMENCHE